MSLTYQAPSKQRGAALVIAMLIVAIVVLLTVTLSNDFLVLFRRVENQLYSQQAYAYVLAAEGVARQTLLKDSELSPDKDHLSEEWLEREGAFAAGEAQVSGRLTDLQGRINITHLQSSLSTPVGKFTVNQQRFMRLLQTLELEQNLTKPEAEEITNAVIDWQDSEKHHKGGVDNTRSPGGAEDIDYSDLDPPYKAANRLMASVTELRAVKGVTQELYLALLPHVTVWGDEGININTATGNVLRSLNEDDVFNPLSQTEVQTLIDEQAIDAEGYTKVTDAMVGSLANIDKQKLVVKSDYFLLESTVVLADREFQLKSVLYRTKNSVVVVARSQGNL